MFSKVIRGVGIGAVIILLLSVVVMSVTKKPNYAEKVWDERATMGVSPEEAKHHYIMYTDVMCPYCNFAARLMIDNAEEFEQYLKDNEIVFEVRMTDFLYKYGTHQVNNSLESGEAVYCAKKQDKFWEYYHGAVDQIWNDYIINGVGSSSTAPMIEDLDGDYWIAIAKKNGLSDEFEKCYLEHGGLTELQQNTDRAYNAVESGLPQFYFDSFETSGFDPNWTFDEFKEMLDQGLKSRS